MTTRTTAATTALAALALAALVADRTASAQISPYYLTDGDNQTIWVLQHGTVVNHWTADNMYEYPIAVWNDVRTRSSNVTYPGGRYALDGTTYHTVYVPWIPPHTSYDATTDGTHNYLMDYLTRELVRTGRAWDGGTVLFTTPQYNTAITFDRAAGTLWMAPQGYPSNLLFNYSLTGTLLGTLATSVAQTAALAYDPADQSLWMYDYATRNTAPTFYQYSRTGQLLSTQVVMELQGTHVLGGEIGNVPEPATLALVASGLLALGGLARRRRATA